MESAGVRAHCAHRECGIYALEHWSGIKAGHNRGVADGNAGGDREALEVARLVVHEWKIAQLGNT